MPLDPEGVLADWQRRVEQQSTLTTELSTRLQAVTASAESPGSEAVVTVDQSGGLAGLRLSDRAMRLSPVELADVILAASRRAQARLAQQVTDLVAVLYGSGSDTAAFIGGTYAAQFPEPDDEDEEDARR